MQSLKNTIIIISPPTTEKNTERLLLIAAIDWSLSIKETSQFSKQ